MMWISRLKQGLLRNKTVLENFSFLSLLQFSNLLLFILIIPYLFRVLGEYYYGLVIYAQSIALYFNILIGYGFNITTTKNISISRNSLRDLDIIVSGTVIIKLALFLLSLSLMTGMTYIFDSFRLHRELYLYSMLFCLSEALFPVWYFQGIEKMKFITFTSIAARVAYTILAIIIIKSPDDYLIYPLLRGAGSLAGAFVALLIMFRQGVRFVIPELRVLWQQLADSTPIFVSNLSSQIYLNANRVILGIASGMESVAFYDVAERIVNIVKMPLFMLNQALFPKIARERNKSLVIRILTPTFIYSIILTMLVFIFAGKLVLVLSGTVSTTGIEALRILSFTIIPVTFSLFYAELLLLPFNYKREYTRVRTFSLLLYTGATSTLWISGSFDLRTAALLLLIIELFVAIYSFRLALSKNLVSLFGKKD